MSRHSMRFLRKGAQGCHTGSTSELLCGERLAAVGERHSSPQARAGRRQAGSPDRLQATDEVIFLR